jgi:hypothetical protein
MYSKILLRVIKLKHVLVPLGFWVAERDQLNSSDDRSSKSRQSEMALERRTSPKTLTNGEIMEATCSTASIVLFTESTNSDEGTFKHSNGRKSEGHTHRISINKSTFSSFVVNDGAILEQLIVFSVKKQEKRN